MEFSTLEVMKWYEKQFKRKLTEAEKACIRGRCVINNFDLQNGKSIKNCEIRLAGLKYEQSEVSDHE